MRRNPKHYRTREPDLTKILTDAASDALYQMKRAATVVVVSIAVVAGSLFVLAAVALFGLMEYRFR